MKNVSPLLLSVILTATVVAVPSFAQSSLSLPGCERAPELRRILDEKLNEEALEKMKTSDRESLQRQVYEELIAKYPREVDPYNRLIVAAHWDPGRYLSLQERFRKQAAQNPSDPLALYVAGFALFGTDTPESLRMLEAAKAQSPQFPWPSLLLAGAYSTGKRMDRQKSSENLAVFFAACPSSTNEWAQMILGTDPDLQPKVATALRARLETETDPARLKDYATLWSLEFRTRPPQEHDALRNQIALDLRRIESLTRRPDPALQMFLINGHKQAGASSETINSMEERLIQDYPHSSEAYQIVNARWQSANKKPEDQKDAVAWSKYHEAYKAALKDWIRDFPDIVGPAAWLSAIFDEDPLAEKDGIAAIDEYLHYSAEYDSPYYSFPRFHAAEFLLNHHWQPSRALDLLEQSKTISDKERASRRPEDNLTPEVQEDMDERNAASDLQTVGEILRAARLAGRPEVANGLKPFVEELPPSQGKLLSAYWWNRARLAGLEGHNPDALAYYQLSLQTRLDRPQYSHGKFRDVLTDEALTLWTGSGGTPAGWVLWSRPFAAKGTELTQGTWEKPNRALPAFELSDLSGKTWRLKDLGGKVVMINLWATWCVPCQAELPKLQKLYDQTKSRSDIQILSFDIDEDLGLVSPFIKDKGYTFPVVPAHSFVNNLLDGYAPIPQNWVVGPKGDWVWRQMGYGEEDDWGQLMLQKLDSTK